MGYSYFYPISTFGYRDKGNTIHLGEQDIRGRHLLWEEELMAITYYSSTIQVKRYLDRSREQS
jgi:hypothetical protein